MYKSVLTERYHLLDNTDNYTKSYANKIQTDLKGTTDTATYNWGKGWKMPTRAQFNEQVANCTSEWAQIDGINGRKFTSKNNSNYIFFPAVGDVGVASLIGRGFHGRCWSSSFHSSVSAWRLYFSPSEQGVYTNNCYFGFSARAVRS